MTENMKNEFKAVTVFILAAYETNLLTKTIEGIKENCSPCDVDRIVIVLKSEDCPSRYEADKIISREDVFRIETYFQKGDSIVKCYSELPSLTTGSHFVVMASDMEMNPTVVKAFITEAKQSPNSVICASKWNRASKVEGYNSFRRFGSELLSFFVSVLYLKWVKDPFSIFQIYPIDVYKDFKLKNPVLFTYAHTLLALRTGVEYKEIPTVYVKRCEGKSSFHLLFFFKLALIYVFTATKIRLTPKRNLNENKTD